MLNIPYFLPSAPPVALCQGTSVAARLSGAGFLTNVRVGHHEFWSDGTFDKGGQNQGPAPYDLLLAALATCTAMTVRLYAQQYEWTLYHVSMHLIHCLAQEELVSEPETIEGQLELVGDLSPMQQHILLNVAANCPVARVLKPGICINLTLKPTRLRAH